MNALSFETAKELAEYATTSAIPKADIVAIRHVDGRWWLFWY